MRYTLFRRTLNNITEFIQFTMQGTNTFVIGTGSHRIIVDTSGGEIGWRQLIEEALTPRGVSLSHVLLTHWHGDHTGGVPDLLQLYPNLSDRIYKSQLVSTSGQRDIKDGQIWTVEGATIRAVHAPGHSVDHMCFVLEEEQAMFTGDNILGNGSSAVEDLSTFMSSLRKMRDEHCSIGYPAHGVTIIDLPGKIRRELNLKVGRENQVLHVLDRSRLCGEKSLTVTDIVTEIYGDCVGSGVGELALEPHTDEILRKLAGEERVAFEKRNGKKKWFSITCRAG